MVSKNRIKFVSSLQQKKFREESGFFVVEGEKMVQELLQSGWAIESLYATEDWLSKYGNHALALTPEEITGFELEKMSSLKTPNQVLAVVPIPSPPDSEKWRNTGLLLALDQVRDPGNLGTIIRLADWFGIPGLLCSKETVDLYNPKTVQATMGSLFRIEMLYDDLSILLPKFKSLGFRLNAALLGGDNLFLLNPPEKEIILLGNESNGISSELIRLCDRKISIPAHPLKTGAESLNVSMAAAVLCAEFRRAAPGFYSK